MQIYLKLVIDAQIVDEQSDLERARTAKIRKYADNPDIERALTAWDRSNQHPSPSGHPLLEGYLVQNIRIRFSDTGHHHPERSRCHQWDHRPPRSRSEDDIAQRRPPSHSLGQRVLFFKYNYIYKINIFLTSDVGFSHILSTNQWTQNNYRNLYRLVLKTHSAGYIYLQKQRYVLFVNYKGIWGVSRQLSKRGTK